MNYHIFILPYYIDLVYLKSGHTNKQNLPTDTRRNYNVIITPKRHRDVVSTH